jgi:hypothetical protein
MVEIEISSRSNFYQRYPRHFLISSNQFEGC